MFALILHRYPHKRSSWLILRVKGTYSIQRGAPPQDDKAVHKLCQLLSVYVLRPLYHVKYELAGEHLLRFPASW